MTIVRKASEEDIHSLSRVLLRSLDDKNGKTYKDNVARFGIPEEYVRKAFAEETLLKAARSGKTTFYIAMENKEIVGFAQTVQQDANVTGLDRIVVFPTHERKGIGTQLLRKVIEDERKKRIQSIIVNAGKEEIHARRFYEKNGFHLVKVTCIKAPWGRELELAIYQLQLES